ncbi:MAG TPA: MATE family efflux transporter [Acidimicrobiales bacterium]|nr:MATE family efflux transporter [Acidimicrobiales bacterium]
MGLSERDRRIARLAVPALGTLAVEPLYVLVDTAIVGRLGTVPLGGLAVASAVLGTVLPVCNFLAYGTTARVAFLTGRGDRRAAASVAAQGLWLCALIGVPLAVALAVGTRPIVAVVGGEGEIAAAARTYLLISCIGIPAVLVALVGHGYLRGVADTRTPLLVSVVANVVNLVLELVLVYGLELGVAGSAWGTVVAQVGAAAWFVGLLRRRLTVAEAPLGLVGAEARRLLLAGRHLFVRTASLLATMAVATAVAARVSPATLGGHQIALQVHLFVALALDAFAIPGQVLVGTLLGADDRAEARATSRRLLQLGLLGGVLVAVVLVATAPVLPTLFTHDPAVLDRARVALVIAGLVQLPGAVAFVLDGVLIGASDFRYLQWSMVVGLVVFLPFAVAVPAAPSLGIGGVWVGLLAWMLARAAANLARYRRGSWLAVPA